MPEPIPLSAFERDGFLQRTVPMTVRVEIEDRETFEAGYLGGGHVALAKAIEAYTLPYAKPCEIHLRAGSMIQAIPSRRQAHFVDDSDGEVIAHELLHCIRGRWHPQ